MRVIRNRVVPEWAVSAQRRLHSPMPKFAAILPTPETTDDFEEMCLAAGESAALVTTIGAAQVVVKTIVQEAEQILEQQRTALASIPAKRSWLV